jgi:hypothetical protein
MHQGMVITRITEKKTEEIHHRKPTDDTEPADTRNNPRVGVVVLHLSPLQPSDLREDEELDDGPRRATAEQDEE